MWVRGTESGSEREREGWNGARHVIGVSPNHFLNVHLYRVTAIQSGYVCSVADYEIRISVLMDDFIAFLYVHTPGDKNRPDNFFFKTAPTPTPPDPPFALPILHPNPLLRGIALQDFPCDWVRCLFPSWTCVCVCVYVSLAILRQYCETHI